MTNLLLLIATFALRVHDRARRDERGDVPGWVLITVMTAGLVAALWAIAGTRAEPDAARRPAVRARLTVPRARRSERGAAVVDFVLVLVVVVPLFLGILQVALVLHVRNTLTSAASEGARYAATVDRPVDAGATRTREQISGALAARYARAVTARPTAVEGAPGVEVEVDRGGAGARAVGSRRCGSTSPATPSRRSPRDAGGSGPSGGPPWSR